MFTKLPRLAINWKDQPEMLRRYWDQAMDAIEKLIAVSPVSVSKLPADPTNRRMLVNDSTSITFGNIVSGGGSITVPVYFDGLVWRIG